MGTPASKSSETKLCRSSRGVQSAGFRPAASVTLRNERRTCDASADVPTYDGNTWSLFCHLLPAVAARGRGGAAERGASSPVARSIMSVRWRDGEGKSHLRRAQKIFVADPANRSIPLDGCDMRIQP